MALKPLVKLKVDELFLRWLSETETQHLLKINLRHILNGEPIPTTLSSGKGGQPASPRGRNASPSTPPCSPISNNKVTSPRSPRRAILKNQAYKHFYNKVSLII